jgi:hypothetical protein
MVQRVDDQHRKGERQTRRRHLMLNGKYFALMAS